MIVSCSQCQAHYTIDGTRLGAAGRTVRCTSCGHTWRQRAVADTVKPKDLPAFQEEPSLEPEAPIVRRFATPSMRKPEPPARNPMFGRIAAFAGPTLIVVAALGLARGPLVEYWPASARLYSVVGLLPDAAAPGLVIRSVHSEAHVENGHRTLIVAGEVANIGTTPHRVPALHATLAQDKAIASRWSFDAGTPELAAGESAKFHTELPDAPEGAGTVSVGVWR